MSQHYVSIFSVAALARACCKRSRTTLRADVAAVAYPELLAASEALASADEPPCGGSPACRDIIHGSHRRRAAAGPARRAAHDALGPRGSWCGRGAGARERPKGIRGAAEYLKPGGTAEIYLRTSRIGTFLVP